MNNHSDLNIVNKIKKENKHVFSSLFDQFHFLSFCCADWYLKDMDNSRLLVQQLVDIWKKRVNINIYRLLICGYVKLALKF